MTVRSQQSHGLKPGGFVRRHLQTVLDFLWSSRSTATMSDGHNPVGSCRECGGGTGFQPVSGRIFMGKMPVPPP
jgi:hypothetical protein